MPVHDSASIEPVSRLRLHTVQAFRTLARDYLASLPDDERERFIDSILWRQGEPKRWLLLLRHMDEYTGFVHMKIDDKRPGWGFILEFYVAPHFRSMGVGRRLFELIVPILRDHGADRVYLLADSTSQPFWRKLGFSETGELEEGQAVMARPI